MVSCRYCRTQNRADATYCNHCGALLAAGASGASVPVPAAPTSGAPAGTTSSPANATGRLPPQSLLAGRYLILKNIGQGGMAAVYQATDIRGNATVAIKEMSQDGLSPSEQQEALDSFRSEANMLMQLRHPNLPRVYEVFSEQGRQYLVMDYIEGQTLEQRQQAAGGGALPQAEVLGWARQIGSVLGYLHAQKPPIIFRDLKPANIMVTPSGRIKLIDFGIARVFAPGRTQDTQVLGTPGFAPPEQYGKAQTDARADIYALGCTLYQLLTGYDPATTPFSLPPMRSRNPAIPLSIQQAVERATRLDRDARYQTVEAFTRDLLAGANGQSAGSAPRVTLPHTAVPSGATTPQPAAGAARSASSSMAAVVVVQPHTADFGRLVAGQRGSLTLTISGQNGAGVRGTIKPLAPWLKVDRDRFDGASTLVQLTAETSAIRATGKQTSTLQLICDSQQLYVPVTLDVQPAPAGAKQQAARPTPSKGAPRAVSAKHLVPARPRGYVPRLLTSAALAFALAAAGMSLGLQLLARVWGLALTAPLALALLLVAALAAGVGALAGAGERLTRGRIKTTLFGTALGSAVAVAASSYWLWSGLQTVLTQHVSPPATALLVVPLALGAGAAIGAEPLHSQWMLIAGGFLRRHAPIVVTLGAVLGGAYAGFVLTQGVLYGCLTPFGIAAGILLGIGIGRVVSRLLGRSGPSGGPSGRPPTRLRARPGLRMRP
jgi:tRNA A-37 threonylcarbamoyl transferase component Bud32